MTTFNRGRVPARLRSLPVLALCGLAIPHAAQAHGIAGDRIFPATLATDDPAAESELSLPTISWETQPRNPDGTVPSEKPTSAASWTCWSRPASPSAWRPPGRR